MRRDAFILCLLTYVLPLTAQTEIRSGPAPAQGPIVLKVGGIQLTAAEFEGLAAALPSSLTPHTAAERKRFADQLARVLMLAEEGNRIGIDQEAAFRDQARYLTSELLARLTERALSERQIIDDAALRAYYEAHHEQYERVRARHILIRTPDSPMPPGTHAAVSTDAEALQKAQSVREKARENFSITAMAESEDTASAKNGGELGWFSRGQMVKSFEDAAFRLQPGQLSEPVRTPFGYHLIQQEGYEVKSFAEVKDEIEKKIRADQAQRALADLRTRTSVSYDADFFAIPK